jgi:hypothetical protein
MRFTPTWGFKQLCTVSYRYISLLPAITDGFLTFV